MADVIFPETELSLVDAGGIWIWQSEPAPFLWEEGQKVRIVWNGVSYEKTVIKPDILGKQTHYYVGDMSILGIDDQTDDPFGIDVLHSVNYEADPSGVKTINLYVISKDPTATMAIYTAEESTEEGISFIKFLCSPKFLYLPKTIWGWKLAQKMIADDVPVLPAGYTAVEYLWNTNRAYIDTGYSAPDGFRCEVDFAYTDFGNSGGRYIVGAHNISSPYQRNGLGWYLNQFALGAGEYSSNCGFNVELNRRYSLNFSTIKGDSFIEVDGTRVFTLNTTDERSANTLLVFYNHYSLNGGSDGTHGKLWSAKIYSPTDELVRDFVPCTNPNGEYGLYDKVEGKFYGNQGIGDFNVASASEPSSTFALRKPINEWELEEDVNG